MDRDVKWAGICSSAKTSSFSLEELEKLTSKLLEAVSVLARYDTILMHPEKVEYLSSLDIAKEKDFTAYSNFKIQTSTLLVDEIKSVRPRSKKKRIQKKWLKKKGTIVPSNKVFLMASNKIWNSFWNKYVAPQIIMDDIIE